VSSSARSRSFEPRQVRADTEVLAAAEGEMLVGAAAHVKGVGIGGNPFAAIGRATGPAVRSASLVEQRGFELPVRFGLFPALERGRSPAVFGQN